MIYEIFLFFILSSFVYAGSAPDLEWQNYFGGPSLDDGYSVEQTSDGGYIIVGNTYSFGLGDSDVWLVKTGPNGSVEWNKTFGSLSYEGVWGVDSVQQTSDGGYILAGVKYSSELADYLFWLIKTDLNGNEEWNKTIGIGGAYGVRQTSDGGYIAGGYNYNQYLGESKAWLIKTDLNGNVEWNKTFGYGYGGGAVANSVQQTLDGGYILAGVQHYPYDGDFLIIKTDQNGNEEWNWTIEHSNSDDWFHSVKQTYDGGYIVVGSTGGFFSGLYDIYLMKIDANGTGEWNRTYGSSLDDGAFSVEQTVDGYILAGRTEAFTAGEDDVWIIKTDSNGDIEWGKKLGGSRADGGIDVQVTSDSGYIIVGWIMSEGAGGSDAWLIKLKNETAYCSNEIKDRDETDIDCGGSCPKCENGKQCLFDSDCQGNYCNEGICETYHCKNGIKDGDETDIDCGGSCQKCSNGKNCLSRHDCVSNFCNALNKCGCIDYDGDGKSDIRCGGDDCNDNNASTIKCPVLLIHGYTSDPSVWTTRFNFSGKLKNDNFIVYEIDYDPGEHPYDAMSDIKDYANILDEDITNILNNTKSAKVDIVAHSMGGLVSRWYTRFGYKNNVRKLIMLGTPNHGSGLFNYRYVTFLALLVPKIGPLITVGLLGTIDAIVGKAGTQMYPCSRFLNILNHNDDYICGGNDILTKNIYYATIGGNKSSWINKALFFGYENDGLVTINSLKLTDIEPPNFQKYYLGHSDLHEDQAVYDSVKNLLLTEGGYLALKVLALKALKEETIIPLQEATYVNSKIDYSDSHFYNVPLTYTNQSTFILSWLNNSNDLKMVLTNPNGTIINDSIGNITYHASDVDNNITYEGFEVLNPVDGVWKVNISVTKGNNVSYTFLVLLDTNLYINLYLNQSNSHLNSPFKIIANATNLNNPVLGANVTVEIKKPSGIIETIKLYDNLSLGSYSNTYSNTTELGVYEITAYVDGVLNDKPFHRQSTIQTEVYEPVDLYLSNSDISFSNSTPFEKQEIQISALIHNKGNIDLENVSIEFYNDDPTYYGKLIGKDIINISANSYGNASILWDATKDCRYIFVLISAFNPFLERDYSNNIANKSISVKAKLLSSLNLPLTKGWNLISIPLNLINNTLPEPFKSIEGNYTCAYAYKNSTWHSYCSGDPSSSNKYLTPTKGFWIYMINDDILEVEGYTIYNITDNLNTNWDLIGYPYLEERNISELLDNVTVYAYNNSKWYSYNSNKPSYLNTLNKFTPSYGYWIKVI